MLPRTMDNAKTTSVPADPRLLSLSKLLPDIRNTIYALLFMHQDTLFLYNTLRAIIANPLALAISVIQTTQPLDMNPYKM
jgi:hypothetical protein